MDKDLLGNIRKKLKTRVSRLSNTNYQLYESKLGQLLDFLHKTTIFTSILENLKNRENIIEDDFQKSLSFRGFQSLETIKNEQDFASLCYRIISHCVTNENAILTVSNNITLETNFNDGLKVFSEMIIVPLWEYIDEALDDQRAILSILIKYKQRCEWFHKGRLLDVWTKETKKGEALLAHDLYEYIFDQGLEFYLEPKSSTGEIDLICKQVGENKLLVDAKIFNPAKKKNKTYIISGFNQMYTYTADYNESTGYLVVFNTSNTDLSIAADSDFIAPCVRHNSKSIYFIIINIGENKSASKRGGLESTIISPDDFVREL